MSETLAGWAETISLDANEIAVVAARRGEARLRFPDREGVKPLALTRAFLNQIEPMARNAAEFSLNGAPVARARIGPLLALMQAAVDFAEGR